MRETRELRQILLHLSEQHHITHERAHAFDRRESKAMSPHRQHAPHATRHTPHATRHTPHATCHTPHATRHTPQGTHPTIHTHSPHVTCQARHAADGSGTRCGSGAQTRTQTGDRHTDSRQQRQAHRRDSRQHRQAKGTQSHGLGQDVQRSAGGTRTRSWAALLPSVPCSWPVGCTDAANVCVCVCVCVFVVCVTDGVDEQHVSHVSHVSHVAHVRHIDTRTCPKNGMSATLSPRSAAAADSRHSRHRSARKLSLKP
jgi:hypothetical protein